MISRDALYTFTESLISGAASNTPLYAAESFRNLKTSVDEANKVVRIECLNGLLNVSTDVKDTERQVTFTAQFWVTPEDGEQTSLDDATDESFEMARQFFEAMAANATLSGLVCDAYGDEFETGSANLGSIERGVTFLDGIINR